MAESQHTSSNGAAHGDVDPQFASEKMKPKRLQRFDSLHMEAGKIPGVSTHAAKVCSPVTSYSIRQESFYCLKLHNCKEIFFVLINLSRFSKYIFIQRYHFAQNCLDDICLVL